MEWLQRRTANLHLSLHPGKTRLVYLGDGQGGFDFLGFHIRMVMSRRYQRWYCQHWPSSRAMASIRERIRAITAPRRKLKQPIEEIVRELNPVIRGWGQYFRVGNSTRQLVQIDRHVQERLALFDSKKRQQRGRRWGVTHTNAWATGLGVHHLSGTVRYLPSATVGT